MTAITGFGTYVPEETITGAEIAARSGIPEDVVVEKMGVAEKHVCPPDDDHVTDMSVRAARDAITDADLSPDDLDLVVYHGSEYKDHVVWSAAADIAHRLGATEAYAKETYALCAGYPITLRELDAHLESGGVETALLVGASREEDLVDYTDTDASFMFNFGSGACATVLEADGNDTDDRTRASVRGHATLTDGSFSRDVIMPAGGSENPASHDTVDAGLHSLTVPDPDDMKRRLGEVSLSNFLTVADDALERSGYGRDDVDFVAVTHMKRSFHDYLTNELGVRDGHHYLDHHGHVQSVDQLLAIQAGLNRGLVTAGDTVLALAAGTGYTWAASVLDWR